MPAAGSQRTSLTAYHSNGNSNYDGDPNSDGNPVRDCDAKRNRDVDTYPNEYAEHHSHCHRNRYCHNDVYSDRYRDDDCNVYADSDSYPCTGTGHCLPQSAGERAAIVFYSVRFRRRRHMRIQH